MLRTSRRPLALAGAGLSAESGIPTFRGAGGLWRNYRPEALATPEAFARDPQTVWEWYAWRRDLVAEAQPNPAHHALARLEHEREAFWLITQNVDGLSQRAGSQRVLELHGSLWRTRCIVCGHEAEDLRTPTPLDTACETCGGRIRPGVVWFGEGLDSQVIAKAQRLVEECDLLLVLGTSARVYPAAGLIPLAVQNGARVIEINPDPSGMSSMVNGLLQGPVGELLPRLLP